MAQSPGVGLHPTILLREEGTNRVSEGNTRPAPPCSALHKTHIRSLGTANLKHLTNSSNSFACPTSHGGRFPNCSTAAAPSDLAAPRNFYTYQNCLHMVGGILFAVPILKKAPIIPNNHTRVFIAKTLLSHSCLCITALLKSHQRGFSQEISMLPEFPQSFASEAGQEGCAPVKDRATEGTGV